MLPDSKPGVVARIRFGLNAPAGAWCSLTAVIVFVLLMRYLSQCTYRCVVLPDPTPKGTPMIDFIMVSMHLQVRGAP